VPEPVVPLRTRMLELRTKPERNAGGMIQLFSARRDELLAVFI
jgi:hypothetical protein